MADLIDRDELLRCLNKKIDNNDYELYRDWYNGINEGIKIAIKYVNYQLSVDTERHAHWINEEYFNGIHHAIRYRCSECNAMASLRWDYCHCGCKMDEVSK